VFLEEAELVGFVSNRPDVDPLHAASAECVELLGEGLRGSDRYTIPQDRLRTVDGGNDPFGKGVSGLLCK
jgi:hypothetical protein